MNKWKQTKDQTSLTFQRGEPTFTGTYFVDWSLSTEHPIELIEIPVQGLITFFVRAIDCYVPSFQRFRPCKRCSHTMDAGSSALGHVVRLWEEASTTHCRDISKWKPQRRISDCTLRRRSRRRLTSATKYTLRMRSGTSG